MNAHGLPRSVDQDLLDAVILHKFEIPAGGTATDYLPGLMTNLGSPDSDLRECSLDVLWTWISQSRYGDSELLNIAQQMAANPPSAWEKRPLTVSFCGLFQL